MTFLAQGLHISLFCFFSSNRMQTPVGSSTRFSLLFPSLWVQSFQLFLPFPLWTWLSVGRCASTAMPSQWRLEPPCSSVSRYDKWISTMSKLLFFQMSKYKQKYFSLPLSVKQCPVLNHTNIGAGSMNCSHPIAPYSYSSFCKVRCDEGFEPSGQDHFRCNHTGQWTASVPSCTGRVNVI